MGGRAEAGRRFRGEEALSLARYFFVSVLVAALLFGTIVGIVKVANLDIPNRTLMCAAIAGFCVTTFGWGIVRLGLMIDPERIIAFFGVAVLVKMGLLGAVSGAVVLEGSMKLEHFLIPFAAVFLLLGFVQLALTVKETTRHLNPVSSGTEGVPGESGK